MAMAPGTRLGRYDIRTPLGAGGMGEVYLAEDTTLHRQVAIKFLPAETAGDDHARRRLLREAQAAATLDHPNICTVHEVGEAGGHHFIVMQLVEGETLAARLARKPLDVTESLALATQLADALTEAHARGILHRDIKPQNVMITPRGQAKLMDFGLAIRAPDASPMAGDAVTESMLTTPGAILGTVKYMSPEQVQGQPLDARSDIFSFGVVLYEMVSGHHPFASDNRAATISAILTRTPEPVAHFAAQAPAELDRIITKAIAKDPGARYQSIKDLLIDLQYLARAPAAPGVTTGSGSPAPRATQLRAALLAGTGVVALVAGGFLLWPHVFPASPVIAPGSKPSVAVMYFQNNTGNTQLDWLRTGLTEMLVTDLSQSPDVEVLGTDSLYQILAALKRQDDPVVSLDTVQEIARRAGVKHVVVGNYMKGGETIRISITLQEAATGKIVSSERVDAVGESNLFPAVDDLIRRIKTTFALSAARGAPTGLIAPPGTAPPSGIFRDLKEVTTASTDAYRYYVQGVDLKRRGSQVEAIPLFEKAIGIDKDFALALANLALIHRNFGHSEESDQYARRAMALTSRLNPRERYFIEGFYYYRDETIQKAIETYTSWLAQYPNDEMAKHFLAMTNSDIERFDEAIRLSEELRQRGVSNATSWGNLAGYYSAVGKFEAARGVLDDWLRRNPDSAGGHAHLGALLVLWGRFDEGLNEYVKVDAIEGGHWAALDWLVAVLQDKWAAADVSARKLALGTDPDSKYDGNVFLAVGEMYRGRMASALRLLEVAATSQGPRGSIKSAHARHLAAAILLAQGNNAKALVQAQRAYEEAGGTFEMWESLYDTALAQSRLGQVAESARTMDTLTAKANAFPGNRPKRRVHELAAVLALDRHDTAQAIDALRRAEDMMPAGGIGVFLPDFLKTRYLPTWFDLGTAFFATGHDTEASVRFQKVVNSTERREYPLQFVRSLYFLGQIAERRGDREQARAYYQRFVNYWGDGDIDRDRVADAKKKLSAAGRIGS